MQAKVSASIANAEEEVPGHVVRTVTQIAERTHQMWGYICTVSFYCVNL
jgi:hypothetical protein